MRRVSKPHSPPAPADAGFDRRRTLEIIGGAGLLAVVGCGAHAGAAADAAPSTDGMASGESAATCATIPEETAGPFPGNDSGGVNYFALAGAVRADIRSSLAPAQGVAEGVPLTMRFIVVNTADACRPAPGWTVYVWQCDREAQYSMYTLPSQNYLRGVQVAGGDGVVTFTSVFPGCYPGRWPHVHFQLFPPGEQPTPSGGSAPRVSQLAFPADACQAVYATAGYGASATNLSRISLATDGVFRDGSNLQVATVTGSVAAGYVARLVVGV